MVGMLLAAVVAMSAPASDDQRQVAQNWSCDARKTCGKIRSCDEAMWYLENCSWGGRLDGDGDGAPCESLCGSNN